MVICNKPYDIQIITIYNLPPHQKRWDLIFSFYQRIVTMKLNLATQSHSGLVLKAVELLMSTTYAPFLLESKKAKLNISIPNNTTNLINLRGRDKKKVLTKQKEGKYYITFVLLNPSANKMISAIIAESGTTIDIGRNILFKLSGSSVRPA